jgi:hypothetical protein
MQKFLSAAAAALLLMSCDVQPVGKDGYRFGEPEFERNDVTIKIVTYDSRQELHQAAKRLGGIEDPNLQAFAQWSPDITIKRCTIHVMNPQVRYEPEWMGHEIAHCFYGQWHTSNNHRG